MIPLLAAIILAGAAGAGPVLVSDACGPDTTEAEHNRSAIEAIDRSMKSRPMPKELKVESDGKLYSLPKDVETVVPPKGPTWWQEFCRKVLLWANREKKKEKSLSDENGDENESSSPSKKKQPGDARSVGEHSCQICFEHDHSTAMLPCGHGGVCWDCGLQIYALTEECPMCRDKIELLVRLDGDNRRREGEEEYVSVVTA